MNFYTVFFDGSCPKNPGNRAAYGYTIYRGPTRLQEGSGGLKGEYLDNNIAEFYALYKGLCHLRGLLSKSGMIEVKGDSALVIKIMSKKWKLRKDRPFHDIAFECQQIVSTLRRKGSNIYFTWIPRSLNQVCDKLSKAKKKNVDKKFKF